MDHARYSYRFIGMWGNQILEACYGGSLADASYLCVVALVEGKEMQETLRIKKPPQ